MTDGPPTCAWPGCRKPPSTSLGYPPHLACDHLHHLLLMLGRLNPNALHHHPDQQIQDRNGKGLCALISCNKAPGPSDSWCSPGHYLTWLAEVYSSLNSDQICKLSGCSDHVYVDEKNRPWEFCGWLHRQQAVMQKALEGLKHSTPHPALPTEHGTYPSMKSLLQSLKRYSLSLIAPRSIKVNGDFFAKHPWEILSGDGETCSLIVPCKFTRGGKCRKRDMVTKDKYHWKQQGPAKKKQGYLKKYFTYKKLQARKRAIDEQQETVVFTMKEYTLEDVKTHSLVKLCRGKHPSHGRGCKVELNVENASSPKFDLENGQLFSDSMCKECLPEVDDWFECDAEGLPSFDDWPPCSSVELC